MPLYLLFGAVPVAAGLGFLAGLITFKRSLVWCKTCGRMLACRVCRE